VATAFASSGAFGLDDLIAALGRFESQLGPTVGRALDRGMKTLALRSAITDFMEGLGSGKNAQPPNPPPGPLGIRSGNLRRDVRAIPAEQTGDGWTAALAAGFSVPYAAIHEFGGDAGRGHKAHIPARPYMTPAIEKTKDQIAAMVQADVEALASSVLG
jgi:hypothetical protein